MYKLFIAYGNYELMTYWKYCCCSCYSCFSQNLRKLVPILWIGCPATGDLSTGFYLLFCI